MSISIRNEIISHLKEIAHEFKNPIHEAEEYLHNCVDHGHDDHDLMIDDDMFYSDYKADIWNTLRNEGEAILSRNKHNWDMRTFIPRIAYVIECKKVLEDWSNVEKEVLAN